MQVRLAFSIAIRAQGDSLVLDEVLAVGDESFQRKCFQYFAQLKKEKKTVILVTHSMDSVQQFCNKAVLVDKGHKVEIGNPADIAQLYRELNSSKKSSVVNNRTVEDDEMVEASVAFENLGEKMIFKIQFEEKEKIEDPVVVFALNRDNGEIVYRWKSDEKMGDMPIDFLPIKFDKLRMKLEAAKRAGYDKAITFEFSHFMSPQSAYLQAGHLYNRYKEYFNIR